jgi:hypothetical protein
VLFRVGLRPRFPAYVRGTTIPADVRSCRWMLGHGVSGQRTSATSCARFPHGMRSVPAGQPARPPFSLRPSESGVRAILDSPGSRSPTAAEEPLETTPNSRGAPRFPRYRRAPTFSAPACESVDSTAPCGQPLGGPPDFNATRGDRQSRATAPRLWTGQPVVDSSAAVGRSAAADSHRKLRSQRRWAISGGAQQREQRRYAAVVGRSAARTVGGSWSISGRGRSTTAGQRRASNDGSATAVNDSGSATAGQQQRVNNDGQQRAAIGGGRRWAGSGRQAAADSQRRTVSDGQSAADSQRRPGDGAAARGLSVAGRTSAPGSIQRRGRSAAVGQRDA